MASCVVWLGTVATISRDQPVTHFSDPAVSFDLRFAETFDQRFPAKAKSAPEQLPAPIGRGRSSAVPTALPDPRTLRRVMDLGVAQYATGANETVRAKGASLVLLSALLDFGPARDLVVRNYPRSPVVRSVVSMQDVVRFAIDLLSAEGTPGESAQPAEEPAVALGSYFARRGELLSFAKHVVDAIADDKRAQTDEQIVRLFSIFVRVPGTCTGIKRAISQDRIIDQNECSDDLRAALLRTAPSRGPIGMESDGRKRALQMLKEEDGIDQLIRN